MRDKVCDFEGHAWDSFCESHPNMRVVQSCLENVSPFLFWSLANQFPDLVSRMHVQVRLMGNLGLNGSLPWLQNTDGAICFICKEDIESVTHFFLDYSYFRNIFESLGDKLKIKIARSNPIDIKWKQMYNLKRKRMEGEVTLFTGYVCCPFCSF